jgi:hypothetical protein
VKKITCIYSILSYSFIASILLGKLCAQVGEAKITYHLITDDGKILQDFPYQANVLKINSFNNSNQTIQLEKNTDKNGNVTFTLPYFFDGIISRVPYNISGYYNSSYKFYPNSLIGGKWQPWNPIINVVIKPIINPIPMYAKTSEITIPDKVVKFGYDLEVGDWVAPNGKGNVSDFIFTLDEKIPFVKPSLPYDFTIKLSFSNKGDGIQGLLVPLSDNSAFRLPRYAPESGYLSSLVQHIYLSNNGMSDGDNSKDQNYFFRVRTILDNCGNVKSTLYGKISGPIECGPNGYIKFTYYLNPTPNDRNMEFDPKRNLSKNLSPWQPTLSP